MEFWRLWSDFCAALQQEGLEQFQTYKRDGKDVTLKITCCDASSELRKQYGQFENVLAFSATLKPFEYYCKLSGFDNETTQVLEAACPFPTENKKVIVIPQVSTKYRDRSANAAKICDAIKRIVELKKANYILFFPSFEYLEQIHARLNAPPDHQILVQRRSMSRLQVTEILDQLKREEGCLLFAVQGGIFAEGVDFAGDMASGAIIIGPGLPAYDLERELLREYYERTYGSGFEYAYTYPAMTKVVQSAGRVVRSETDRGLVVLMDRRFVDDTYALAMPKDWFADSVHELVSNSILKDISAFWQEHALATS
jgi:DNA excision repair protein ERCC-2